MKNLFIAFALLIICGNSQAEDRSFRNMVYVSGMQTFAIAGVLRKASETLVIKLTQSVETARSEEEAIGQFTRKVQQDFPGYAIWDTVVTTLPRKVCQTTI